MTRNTQTAKTAKADAGMIADATLQAMADAAKADVDAKADDDAMAQTMAMADADNAAYDDAKAKAMAKAMAMADKDNAAFDAKVIADAAKAKAKADKAWLKMMADADKDNAAFDKAIADAALIDDLTDKFDALADAAGGMVFGNICKATRAVAKWFQGKGYSRAQFIAAGVANGCNQRNLAIEWHYGVNTNAYIVDDLTDDMIADFNDDGDDDQDDDAQD